MSRLAVLATLPAVAAVCAAEIVRRGFAAPVIYGVKQWCAAMHRDDTNYEPDFMP